MIYGWHAFAAGIKNKVVESFLSFVYLYYDEENEQVIKHMACLVCCLHESEAWLSSSNELVEV